ncbi:MAG: transcriptional repressor LexA [bacterium]|nr:transcriptional repressor LexA [bacterium]
MPNSQPHSHLNTLKRFYWRNRRLPSRAELARLCGFKSKNAAQYWIRRWCEQGVLRADTGGRLRPGDKLFALKVLGTVEAGWPSPAEEEMVDTISLDDWLITNKQSSFMLTVSGDSMIDAGIHPGDTVILDRSRLPKHGDVVVAEIDHDWTIKFYEKRGRDIVLQPANRRFKTLVPKEELRVAGVVTAVIRKYHR